MIKEASVLKIGQKVHYQPEHYGEAEWENGLIKEIPDFASDSEPTIEYKCVRVVYNCNDDWKNYKNYTSALTHIRDLKLGWKHTEK